MIHQIVFDFYPQGWPAFYANYAPVLGVMLLGYLLHFIPLKVDELIIQKTSTIHWIFKASVATAIIVVIIFLKQADPVMPVYLQF